jgi:hypothetical protein
VKGGETVLRLCMLLALLLIQAHPAQAATAGIASQVSGSAEVRAAGGAWKPLRVLQRLDAGAQVRCGAGSSVVVVLFENAARYHVGAGSVATVQAGQVNGAQKESAMAGPAIRIAKAMGGSRADAFLARPAQSHQRLTPQFPGWMLEGERHFEWTPIAGAATYTFSLFDTNDNVVWSVRVSDSHADFPADLPYFSLRRPHVWRLAAFGQSGKPLPEARWGFLTFLSKEDADQLTMEAQELDAQARAESTDSTALVMLAELYRSYGVLEKALEALESPLLVSQPGIQEAQAEIYRQAGRFAQLLRPHDPGSDTEAGRSNQ